MKLSFKFIALFAALFCVFGINSVQAQRTSSGSLQSQIDKLDLSSEAKTQVMKWEKASDFRLTKEGNFVPYFPSNKRTSSTTTRNSRPYEGPLDLAGSDGGGGDCVKIPCPGTFSDKFTCWECH